MATHRLRAERQSGRASVCFVQGEREQIGRAFDWFIQLGGQFNSILFALIHPFIQLDLDVRPAGRQADHLLVHFSNARPPARSLTDSEANEKPEDCALLSGPL